VKPVMALRATVIIEEGQPGSEMYLVMKGEVEVKHAGTTLGFLSEGSFFGESPVLADDQEPGSLIRSRTIVAVTDCDMCYLTRDSVQGLMLEYPELEKRIKSLAHFGRSNSQSKIWARVSALARMRLKLKKTAERARRNSINPSAANIAIKKIEKQIKEEDDQLQKMASGFREEDSRQQKVLASQTMTPKNKDTRQIIVNLEHKMDAKFEMLATRISKSMSGAGALPTVPEGALRPLQTSMSPATSSIDEVLTRGLAKIEESMQQKLDSVRQELGAQISALQNEMTINSALHAEGP